MYIPFWILILLALAIFALGGYYARNHPEEFSDDSDDDEPESPDVDDSSPL